MWAGNIMCVRAVYWVVGWYTVCYGGVLYVRVVHCVVSRSTVWHSCVMCVKRHGVW